jgi:RHS repeat-associated protein
VTDPAGKVRKMRKDGLGRLVEVIESPAAGINYSTIYDYDPLDNLTHVYQGSQTRTFEYSSLGRLNKAINPESGTILYAYDDSGNLATRTDALLKVTTMSYDDLHRLVTKSYRDSNNNPAAPTVTYEYYPARILGQPSNLQPNIGQLKSVSSSVGSTTYTYNQLGKVSGSTQTIAGYSGNMNFSYDWYLNDGLYRIQYPSGKIVTYELDGAGRVNKVQDSSTTYVDMTADAGITYPYYPYTADGRIANMKLGNGLFESREYNTPGMPTLYKLGDLLGSGNRTQLEYNFSGTQNNGNLESQVITRPGGSWTQAFPPTSYDGMNRLIAASEVSGYSRTYGYDRWGNRYVATSTGLAHPDTSEPTSSGDFNTNNQLRTSPGVYNYDAAGNQLKYGAFTLVYDAENRNTTVTSTGSGSGSYAYDGDGRRIKKVWTPAGGTAVTTYYAYDALGQLAAEYSTQAPTSTGTSYIFSDMLGSVRTITSSSKTVTECYDYLPFGRMLSSSDNGRISVGSIVNGTFQSCYPAAPDTPDTQLTSATEQKFTGKERDAETELDYFGARYYSGAQGRFLSSDNPKFSEVSDPQSWNLYSYVGNNPIVRVDPLGHNWFDFSGSWQWYEGADVDSYGKPCHRGGQGCHHSDYTHITIYEEKYRKNGTSYGTVTMYGNKGGFIDSNVLAKDDVAFSGGAEGRSPIEPGDYEINLNRHGGLDTQRAVSYMDPSLVSFHNGIQDIGGNIPIGKGFFVDFSGQWGDMRAHLIPLDGQASDTYLHGKDLYFSEGLNKTHACIATPYQQVLGKMFSMSPSEVGEGAKNGRILVSVEGTR